MPGFGSSDKMIIEGNAFGKYGMPSSHTQFMFFFATVLPLFFCLLKRQQQQQQKQQNVKILQFLSYVLAAMVAYSRVHFEYHTYSQVTVGALVGIALGIVWTWMYKMVIEPKVIPAIASTSIAKQLGIVSKRLQVLEKEEKEAGDAKKQE